jgi:hypothetical protein
MASSSSNPPSTSPMKETSVPPKPSTFSGSQTELSSQKFSLPFRATPPEDNSPAFRFRFLDHQSGQGSAATPSPSPQANKSAPPLFPFSDTAASPVFTFGGRQDPQINGPPAATDAAPSQPTISQGDGLLNPPAFAFTEPPGSSGGSESSKPLFKFLGGGNLHERRDDTSHPEFHQTDKQDSTPKSDPTTFSLRVLHNTTPSPSPKLSFSELARTPNTDNDTDTKSDVPRPRRAADIPPDSVNASPRNAENNASLAPAPPLTGADRSDQTRHVRSTSDISAISEGNVDVVPYDVRDEQAPSHRFFTSEFQTTLHRGLKVASNTVAAIRDTGDLATSDTALGKLLKDAKKLCAFHGSDTRTIAVLGDSGEGSESTFSFPITVLKSGQGKVVLSILFYTIRESQRLFVLNHAMNPRCSGLTDLTGRYWFSLYLSGDRIPPKS